MILGIGTDIAYIPRIERLHKKFGQKFSNKILTTQEIEVITTKSGKQLYGHIAKRFAAKEAFVKALGTGFSQNISLHDIEIFNNKMGKPYYIINQKLNDYILHTIFNQKFIVHLSLSDEYPIALAFAIIEIL